MATLDSGGLSSATVYAAGGMYEHSSRYEVFMLKQQPIASNTKLGELRLDELSKDRQRMSERRAYHEFVPYTINETKYLCALGGKTYYSSLSSLSSVECFDGTDWIKVPPMPYAAAHFGACAF